jgi:hypothetical protein
MTSSVGGLLEIRRLTKSRCGNGTWGTRRGAGNFFLKEDFFDLPSAAFVAFFPV